MSSQGLLSGCCQVAVGLSSCRAVGPLLDSLTSLDSTYTCWLSGFLFILLSGSVGSVRSCRLTAVDCRVAVWVTSGRAVKLSTHGVPWPVRSAVGALATPLYYCVVTSWSLAPILRSKGTMGCVSPSRARFLSSASEILRQLQDC